MTLLLAAVLLFNSAGVTHATESPLLNSKHEIDMSKAPPYLLSQVPPVKLTQRVKNIGGRKYGKLKVLYFSGCREKQAYWVCLCDCGVLKELRARALANGGTISCGCWIKGVHTHGGCVDHRTEYRTLANIIDRCTNPRNKAFKHYGGRGITIAKEWDHLSKFGAFFKHVGPKPKDKNCLGRLDNDRGYEPGNVAWTTWFFEARNRRDNRLLTHKGVTACIAQWAEILEEDGSMLRARLKRNWPVDRTLTQHVYKTDQRSRFSDGTFSKETP